MDTQSASMVDIPNLKLAKVGKDRDRKRGGAAWSGARSASSAFSGAAGGAGGGILGTGMSLAKMLMVLLVSGGISAGAWQMGSMIAGRSAAVAKPAAPKLFADKEPQKYADTSGAVKEDKSIPNSIGYVNNDGLTDEQRAAKKAADEAAARKAAEDAQARADADAKKKAAEDARTAAAAPPPAAASAADAIKKALPAGKFGSLTSSFGGGGSGLSGGAGMSGGIGRTFAGASGLGANKGQSGALSSFQAAAAKAATTRASAPPHASSNLKGFAKQQADMTNQLSRAALGSAQPESAAAGAAAPFDNNPAQGTVISGPGLASGSPAGSGADAAGSPNASSGGGGGPTGAAAAPACTSGQEPDVNGNCQNISTPSSKNAAPYQGLIDAVMIMLGVVMLLSLLALVFKKIPPYGTGIAKALCYVVAALGVAIAAIGVEIAAMTGGDFMIGAIIGVIGAFIAAVAIIDTYATSYIGALTQPAAVLVASAVGELAAASADGSSLM